MTDKDFCKLYSSYYGEPIDKVAQLVQTVLTGEELKELIEFFIEHCDIEKVLRERALRNMMQGDEELGLYKSE